ncbi:MAG: SCO family protein [Bacteroidia bacterium]|nr:SCO family protein [Bacteroidia bacterium]
MNKCIAIFCVLTLLIFAGCQHTPSPLPILGIHDIQGTDTTYHHIPDFRFMNQDSQWITNQTYEDKLYIAEFFFTSCPTICPKVKQQLMRVDERFKDDDRVMILSHTIDFRRDSIPRLKNYADKLSIQAPKWSLVYGPQEEIYTIDSAYLSVALVSEDAPGGYDHSGLLVMVDKNRHVRSYCYGTEEDDVDRFILDIDKLLREEY